jgi:immune inhibitor A
MCLHKEVLSGNGQSQTVQILSACAPTNAGVATFNDSDPAAYYSSANAQNSVLVAGHGVTATVTGQSGNVLTVNVVNPAG